MQAIAQSLVGRISRIRRPTSTAAVASGGKKMVRNLWEEEYQLQPVRPIADEEPA
jgi:hypothetical protein